MCKIDFVRRISAKTFAIAANRSLSWTIVIYGPSYKARNGKCVVIDTEKGDKITFLEVKKEVRCACFTPGIGEAVDLIPYVIPYVFATPQKVKKKVDGRTNDGRTDGRTRTNAEQFLVPVQQMPVVRSSLALSVSYYVCTDGRTDGRMDRRTDGRTDRQTNVKNVTSRLYDVKSF